MKLEIGTFVEQKERAFDRVTCGIVVQLLSMQAVFVTKDGQRRICLYNEDWKPVNNPKPKKEDLKAGASWRSHENRTCIIVAVKGDVISYIPVTADNPLRVETADREKFEGKLYVCPIDYPADQAARLFVEYSREIGATDEALKALSSYTTITDEEMKMAKAKNTASESGATAGKTATKAKAKAEPKAKAEKAPRGPSASALFMEMLMEPGENGECKYSDDQIFAAVQKKFDLEEKKRSYVAWYRNKLDKEGKNPPRRKGGAAGIRGRGRPAKEGDKATTAKAAPAKKAAVKKPAAKKPAAKSKPKAE